MNSLKKFINLLRLPIIGQPCKVRSSAPFLPWTIPNICTMTSLWAAKVNKDGEKCIRPPPHTKYPSKATPTYHPQLITCLRKKNLPLFSNFSPQTSSITVPNFTLAPGPYTLSKILLFTTLPRESLVLVKRQFHLLKSVLLSFESLLTPKCPFSLLKHTNDHLTRCGFFSRVPLHQRQSLWIRFSQPYKLGKPEKGHGVDGHSHTRKDAPKGLISL